MTTITLVGPGAIGGTVAAWLAQNPAFAVTVSARTRFGHLEVDTPTGLIKATPRVITELAEATPCDWILIATKAYDVAGAAEWIKKILQPHTCVAVLQNGVEHIERFAPYMPLAQIVPVMIDCPAERTSPGRISQRGPARMVVPASVNGRAFMQLFAHTPFSVTTHEDFKSQVWKKLCLNNAGALSAILQKPSVISHHDGIAEIMRAMVRECIAVGRAEGAVLEDSLADSVVASYRLAPKDSLNSLHADRIAGRPMETDARNGVIVRLGRKHGIATPINALVVALLEAAAL